MVLVKNKHYYETLDILRGKIKLLPIYEELKEFIRLKYNAVAYNFILSKYKAKRIEKRYELNILLATENDCEKVSHGIHFDKNIQTEIADKFFELSRQYKYKKLSSSNDVLVWRIDFSKEIKTHANKKAVAEASKFIKNKYAAYNIWTVKAAFFTSTVFFLTDDDLKNNRSIEKGITDDYFNILKKYDEFSVFDRTDFYLEFDSKQNLDEKHGGNLWYYFK